MTDPSHEPARFSVARGCADLRVRTRPSVPGLVELDTSLPWRVERSDRSVTVRAPSFLQALQHGYPFTELHAEATLDAAQAWAIEVRGGATRLDADLRGSRLRALTIRGGLSGAVLALPPPEGVVRLEIHGGVSRLFLMRPADAALRVEIRGGAASLEVDELRLGAVGGRFDWASSEADDARDVYELVVHGGAASLSCVRGEPAYAGRTGGLLAPLLATTA